jgi:hypothetical protein
MRADLDPGEGRDLVDLFEHGAETCPDGMTCVLDTLCMWP